MVNLFDITRQSGSGAGLDALSRQFGLDSVQTMRAVEAVLPAFTLAFQRMALNPSAFGELTKAIGSGQYAPFYDLTNPAQAAASGAPLVRQLFKSPEAADQVAAQAAALAGVGTKALQDMMPILAAMIAGGVFRFASVQGFADLLRQWGDALKAASERLDPPKPQDPWTAWQQATTAMMGLQPQRPAPPPPRPQASPGLDPMSVLDAWVAMVGGMTGMSSKDAAAAPHGRPALAPAAPPPGGLSAAPHPSAEAPRAGQHRPGATEQNPFEALSDMFQTGREVQTQHLAAFQSILDGVWGPARKP